MFEKDYLMRQLMQLLETLQRILRNRKQGDTRLAQEEIRDFYGLLKIEENIDEMTISEMLPLLTEKKKLVNEQIEMLAYVMKEQGEMETSEEKRLGYFRKSHFLLEKVEHESITFSLDRLMKIGELKEYLNGK